MTSLLQITGFFGAMLILIAYIAHQTKRMDSNGPLYNMMNALGAGILAYVALHPFQIGFLVLEGTWTVVSLVALVRALKTPSSPSTA